MKHYVRVVLAPRAAGEEQLTAELWALGTRGTEELPPMDGRRRLAAYFDDLPEALRGRNEGELAGAVVVSVDSLEERDWLASYRAASRPVELGRLAIVDPREPSLAGAEAELSQRPIRLVLPARNAFGTGSHESTRLVVELLDDVDLTGATVLDVGYGSGILSFYSTERGARRVVGCEVDPVAALVGGQNRRLNRSAPGFVAGRVASLADGVRFDCVLVNVLPERIAADLPRLRRLLADDGLAVFSGILATAREAVWKRLERHGFAVNRERRCGDWLACGTEPAPVREPSEGRTAW